MSRSEESARRLANLANFRAAALGCELECEAAATTWEEADLEEHIAKCLPRLVLHAASFQSPWPKDDADSLWRKAMRQHGFGLTTALQAVLAFRVARATHAGARGAAFVNCCYPDAVNPLLAQAKIPVTCGAGNVSIIAALWRSRVRSAAPVRILAHHAHLMQLARPGTGDGVLPRVWVGEKECDRVREVLGSLQFPEGKAMNHLTGAVTATLAQALLGKRAVHTNAPGPSGWVGGYPVVVHSGKAALDLPRGLSPSQARAFNEEAQLAEGIVSIGREGLRYTEALATELRLCGSQFAEGFGVDKVEEAARDLQEVRFRMGGNAP